MRIQTAPSDRMVILVAEEDASLSRDLRRLLEESGSRCADGLTKTQAEQLLDWLENHDFTGFAVTMEGDSFAVRCVCPPGMRPSADKGGGVCLRRQERSASP